MPPSSRPRRSSKQARLLVSVAVVIGGLLIAFELAQRQRLIVDLFANSSVSEYRQAVTPTAVRPPDPTAAASKRPPFSVEEQDAWIDGVFRAADPLEQAWCQSALKEGTYWKSTPAARGAQYSQDVFVARNVFLDVVMADPNYRGFYIEAGANHYQYLSTTYFFDKCLGWEGLCIEPNPLYHDELQRLRSCTLIPKCLTTETMEMMLGGRPAHRAGGMFVQNIPADDVVPNGWTRISCDPLTTILVDTNSSFHIDFFVLDVEGAEFQVLKTIDWSQLSFESILIEDTRWPALSARRIDYDMNMRGYAKFHQLAIDTLYVRRRHAAHLRDTLWYAPQWTVFEKKNIAPLPV